MRRARDVEVIVTFRGAVLAAPSCQQDGRRVTDERSRPGRYAETRGLLGRCAPGMEPRTRDSPHGHPGCEIALAIMMAGLSVRSSTKHDALYDGCGRHKAGKPTSAIMLALANELR